MSSCPAGLLNIFLAHLLCFAHAPAAAFNDCANRMRLLMRVCRLASFSLMLCSRSLHSGKADRAALCALKDGRLSHPKWRRRNSGPNAKCPWAGNYNDTPSSGPFPPPSPLSRACLGGAWLVESTSTSERGLGPPLPAWPAISGGWTCGRLVGSRWAASGVLAASGTWAGGSAPWRCMIGCCR